VQTLAHKLVASVPWPIGSSAPFDVPVSSHCDFNVREKVARGPAVTTGRGPVEFV
jgi:hypothetical protein